MADEKEISEPEKSPAETEDTQEGSGQQGEKSENDERNVIEPGEFATLELTLEEARRQYDDEERRRAAVENKIGIVVTVDALLISFGAIFGQDLNPLLLVLVMVPALASAGLGLWTIRSRDYDRPGKHIRDFHDYSDYDDNDAQREQLLLDYETTTGENKKKNDPKFTYFNWCIGLTFISLVLVLLSPVGQHFGINSWLIELGAGVADHFGKIAPGWISGGQGPGSSNHTATTVNSTTTN